MGFVVGAIVVAFFAVVLLIIGVALGREARYFEQNKRAGQAEVVGYDRADQSEWYTLAVRIPALKDGKIYGCKSGKINLSKYPKGTVVDVFYAPKKVAGIKVVEVHLRDKPPANGAKVSRGIKAIAKVMLGIACVLVALWVTTIL